MYKKLILTVLMFILFVPGSASGQTCIPTGGTSTDVMAALNATGEARLCQGAIIDATDPMILTGSGWKIYTDGYPVLDSLKATIIVPSGAVYAYAPIQAYSAPSVQIRNIRIDGNRSNNPFSYSRALLAIAGNDSLVDQVVLTNTSGISAIAAADNPNCDGLRITNNVIVDNGLHDLDGAGSPLWANGIDVRCSNAVISGNLIQNATDGAISFYGGTNTLIANNIIVNDTRSAISGIIAAGLFAGDFTGSRISYNTVTVSGGQHVHTAYSLGTRAWCDPVQNNGDCQIVSGIDFENNTATGKVGFGLIVDGMQNATVLNNVLSTSQWTTQACFLNGKMKYTYNPTTASGTLQSGYTVRALTWPCIGPMDQ